MRILAIDTSTAAASSAIMEDGRLLCEFTINDGRKHSEKMMNIINIALENSGMDISQIDAFACSIGPGSFTGLRLGAAAVKGLGQALNKPLIAVPTLEALAFNLFPYNGLICPMLDAQRKMVYSSLYKIEDNKLLKLEDYRAIDIDKLINRLMEYEEKIVVLGDGVPIFGQKMKDVLPNVVEASPATLYPRASSVAVLAEELYKEGKTINYNELELYYIRKSQAEVEYDKKEKVEILPMKKEDVKAVHDIECKSFTTPWSLESFEAEIYNNMARYLVAKINGEVVGYGGMWIILDEGHITNIAVHPDHRSKKIGDALVKDLISLARENDLKRMTLEVRTSNWPAINLYKKYGFKEAGVRKGYYQDTGEDALIMWLEL
ncbi:tRNA (adenosine(37)-N6)-threonylcarbamoyltransferase complex dimerization subunit type 1 TsaB [Lutispora thermophila]|uniref:Ribosomal-protein-alanine acetyltransferase/tRNA threonylcarbamoyl adenosine modification protein YeaZ,TIGR03725 n=1 Tax=Lutispora thermophila DSM 19022 TaxID=1122184 RepID=A0A1M6ATA0_9FIRM|nr:tRNA (adenosine(37)-N6)-threonylcarbamoyltransferase complex dimerization subunit type 1 TsaB [Lutispora thermophila]SHI39739.1 ribosomal-protein-alanine acetyltransferase/tRNA threonylcarbamoyl adenosine modification protein YeaZ,TIGR03725 [Lutispora thermophila DSM 19022]